MKHLTKYWRHSSLSQRWKLKVYRTVVIPILTYGLGVESLSQPELQRLDGIHARFLRRVLGIPTTYYTKIIDPTAHTTTNAEVLQQSHTSPLTDYVATEQLKLLGHILRTGSDDLMHDITFTTGWGLRGFSGKGQKGARRTKWLDRTSQQAWQRCHEHKYTAPLHRDPHNRPTTSQLFPFNPHFTHNPFESSTFPESTGLIPLRVVSQYRHFWRDKVVRAPTRVSQAPQGDPGGQ